MEPILFQASLLNITEIDMLEEWKKFTVKCKLLKDTPLCELHVHYEPDGTVVRYNIQTVLKKGNDQYIYTCNYNKQLLEYKIHRKRQVFDCHLESISAYDPKIIKEQLRWITKGIKSGGIYPEGEFDFYGMSYSGKATTNVDSHKCYHLKEDKIKDMKNEQLPINGHFITFYGMEQFNKTKYISSPKSHYFFTMDEV